MADATVAEEEYLQTIFWLQEAGLPMTGANVARAMQLSAPTVHEMVGRLERDGYITRAADKAISFTDSGREHAETVVRRHRLIERFLTDVLGLSWAEAHAEAGKWEHVISNSVESALRRVLNDPTTCPHGNPIPGADYVAPDTMLLREVAVGDEFTISRIPEELEFEPGMLDFLEAHSLQPGHTGVLTVLSPDGTATVEMDGAHVGVPAFASQRILVTA